MPEDLEVVSIVPVQAILRPEPHESPTVLQDAHHAALREPLFDREMLEDRFRL
jgi:hypothetical protein